MPTAVGAAVAARCGAPQDTAKGCHADRGGSAAPDAEAGPLALSGEAWLFAGQDAWLPCSCVWEARLSCAANDQGEERNRSKIDGVTSTRRRQEQ